MIFKWQIKTGKSKELSNSPEPNASPAFIKHTNHLRILEGCTFLFSESGQDPRFCISNATLYGTSFEGQVSREPTQLLLTHLILFSLLNENQCTIQCFKLMEWNCNKEKKMWISQLCVTSICTKKLKYKLLKEFQNRSRNIRPKAITYILLGFTEPLQNINSMFICKITDCRGAAKLLTKPHTKQRLTWLLLWCAIFKK